MLEQHVAEWERINTKRRMVILSLPRDAHNQPNLAKAPASIKILIREMMVPKPYFPKVDASLLEDDKVHTHARRFAFDLCFCRVLRRHLLSLCACCTAPQSHAPCTCLQTIQLCHDIIKTEYAVLAAPVESPTRLKPTMERRSRRKDKVAAELTASDSAAL
jgi:hypothetical protein